MPFQFGGPVAQPTKSTTTTEMTTKKVNIGSSSPQSLTGLASPTDPTKGTCSISQPQDTKLFVAINERFAKDVCGKCVFIWCPSFSGCKGNPLPKVQIVSTFSGPADIALSAQGMISKVH